MRSILLFPAVSSRQRHFQSFFPFALFSFFSLVFSSHSVVLYSMRTVLLLLFASAIGMFFLFYSTQTFLFLSCFLCEEFSEQGKLNLLNAHNEYRSKLALGQFSVRGVKKPAASRMRKMFSYSYFSKMEYFKGTQAPQKWWQEFETNGWDSLIYNHVAQRFQIGHAVQMAWHETSKVGCGYAKCGMGTPDQTLVVVCRYYKKGNMEGESIYEEGATCSKCPEEYQKCPFGLCEKEGVDTD
ncbi:hypothetical protein CRE_07147 [Caenorhabditis remanei]|uniref:SCP domain-containing protein n=1 Tax=Caenorhabditis remanei TaxID=31234 RepID=E3NRD5_CAERE|nr:hypothetical protein CRE_07147 [Caenorhabditis remanei]